MAAVNITPLLETCFSVREALFDARHESALRLFNGFTEGFPNLIVDIYGTTAVLYNHTDPSESMRRQVDIADDFLRTHLPWVRTCILKTRNSKSQEEKRGRLLFGDKPSRKIKEQGVWYAVDLTMNQDASFYLDTRNLRRWASDNLKGKTMLNTFAYTGSLGIAALAGGASRVIQLDRNRQFLNLGKTSCTLNGFPIHKGDFISADFFEQAGRFKRQGEFFDCVFFDPPFFSSSNRGVVDQVHESARLINKVRPLVRDGGTLVAVNNALYVSGAEYMQALETLCEDGFLEISELIQVPEDMTGYPETRVGDPITDPAPFNHSTKIAVLKVKRKAVKEPAALKTTVP